MYSVKVKGRPLWACHDTVDGFSCFTRRRVLFDTRWEAMGKRVFGDDYKEVCYAVKEVVR